jgi:hypothetical protein
MDPDLASQHLPPRALAELGEVRRQLITADAHLVSRRSPFQQQVLKALHVDTSA